MTFCVIDKVSAQLTGPCWSPHGEKRPFPQPRAPLSFHTQPPPPERNHLSHTHTHTHTHTRFTSKENRDLPQATQLVLEAELKEKASKFQPKALSTLMDSAPDEVLQKGPWEYVWLSPFAVHLKLSQGWLLIGHTPKQNKKSRKRERERDLRSKSSLFALNSNITFVWCNNKFQCFPERSPY